MPIGTAGAIGIVGASALAEYLLGADAESMSPEQRRALEFVFDELKKGDMGFSTAEKAGLRKNLKTGLEETSKENIGRGTQSLARRNLVSSGQITGLTTNILSGAGKAFGQGITDIDIASEQFGRQREAQLLSLLPGLSRGIPEGEQSIGGDLSGFIQNLAFNSASRRRRRPGINRGGFSNLQVPAFQRTG